MPIKTLVEMKAQAASRPRRQTLPKPETKAPAMFTDKNDSEKREHQRLVKEYRRRLAELTTKLPYAPEPGKR